MAVYLWLLFGILAFAFVITGLIRTRLKKKKGWQFLLFLSLIFGIGSLLAALAETYIYVERSDWSAMLDVFPTLYSISAVCALIGILLNTLLFLINIKKK